MITTLVSFPWGQPGSSLLRLPLAGFTPTHRLRVTRLEHWQNHLY
jgi:hypothetical protein